MALILIAQTLTFQTKAPESASGFYWIPFVFIGVAIVIALVAVVAANRGHLLDREDVDR